MSDRIFVGRKKELERLNEIYRKKTPSLVVIKGRRRIGKSRLISHFASQQKKGKLWSFAGLAPQDGLDDQSQRDYFAHQLASYLKVPPFTFSDWTNAFDYLSQQVQTNDIVLFDEISWMGMKDPLFIPKLKAWWDKQKEQVMVFFCGSISTWIEDNIINSTAFFGRINLTISLEPLSIPYSNELLKEMGFHGSDYDTYKLLSIMGGVPWYLEQASPGQTADNIIKQLCFEKDGLLVTEFNRIFYDLFEGKGASYKKILDSLKEGMRTLAEIRKIAEFPPSGTLSKYIDRLTTAGFVQKQDLWSFKTNKPSKQSLYRISDPYMRFYLKLIEPHMNKILLNGFEDSSISNLPGFDAHLGLQIEYLLLQNRDLLLKAIGINGSDIINSGPYRQSKTSTKDGCQIDFLVQTKTKNIFICEFKFKLREIGSEITSEVQKKINALKVPRGFAVIPVLFHIGGVSSNLATSNYFYRIIDIRDFL